MLKWYDEEILYWIFRVRPWVWLALAAAIVWAVMIWDPSALSYIPKQHGE